MIKENRFFDRYRTGQTPWAHARPDFNLIEMVQKHKITPSKVLDAGCGLGVESVWMAQSGFEVTATDIAPIAIEKARDSAQSTNLAINWLTMDLLSDSFDNDSFGFIFDRGFFHAFDLPEERTLIAQKFNRFLKTGGLWLTLMGNGDGVAERTGPPLRRASDLVVAAEPYFEILSLDVSVFGNESENPHKIWRCLMRKREV